ncbi:hypothetical protein [uncultured Pseudomonas sp.]|uniref:hypothetical protein n=1 Tax=uncultured Pseudomonas sp. TaxID=114707 RepID=UPI0026174AFA|nr:hypothetical protein [uncultured Pseudomonas sp.]
MNFYKALFLCLLLSNGFSVDRLLQANNINVYSVSKVCVDPAISLFNCRTQAVDESDGYPQGRLSSVLSQGYKQGLGWVFHRA